MTVTFDSYKDAKKITTASLNNAGDTLTWTGGVASIANDTRIALEGSTGTHGVTNGPDQTYWVVSSGTRSVQLAATKGGAAIAITGDESSITIQFPTLPVKGFHLDPTTGLLAAAGADLIAGTVNFSVRADNGSTIIPQDTSIVVGTGGGGGGGQYDIAIEDIAGVTLGLDPTNIADLTVRQKAQQNVTKINAAAASLVAAGHNGAFYSRTGQKLVQSWTGVYIGAGNAGKLAKWYLSNVDLEVMYDEPIGTNPNGTGNERYGLSLIPGAAGCEVQFKSINMHGKNQKQTDAARTNGSKNGAEFGCLRIQQPEGPVKLGASAAKPLVLLNPRGTVGSNQNQTIGGVSVLCTEMFHLSLQRPSGGGTGWVHSEHDDGCTLGTRASGFVIEHAHPDATGQFPWCRYLATATNCRHGMGCYDGGRIQWMVGSGGSFCEHLFNLEAGVLPTAAAERAIQRNTIRVIIGADVLGDVTGTPVAANYGDIVTHDNDLAIQYNGASDGNGRGIGQYEANGVTSTDDGSSSFGVFNATGNLPWSDATLGCNATITLRKWRVTRPVNGASRFGTAALAAKATLVDCAVNSGAGNKGASGYTGAWGSF